MMRNMWYVAAVLVPVVKAFVVIATISTTGGIVTDRMAVARGLISLGWRMVALGIVVSSNLGFQGSSDEGVKVPPTLEVRV